MSSRIVISNIKNNFMRTLLGVGGCSGQWTNTLFFFPKKSIFWRICLKIFWEHFSTDFNSYSTESKLTTEVRALIRGRVSVWCMMRCSSQAQALPNPAGSVCTGLWGFWNCSCAILFPHVSFPSQSIFVMSVTELSETASQLEVSRCCRARG